MIAVALALAAAAAPALQPLQFLVGHCWRTMLKDGPTDTHCFASVAGGQQIRDRHAVRKEGKVIYTGESVISVVKAGLHYVYLGSNGLKYDGPIRVTGEKVIFDSTDNTGSETYWRHVDPTHYEQVTTDPPELKRFDEHKIFELVADERP
jgi:hypothetical protein